LFDWLTNLVFPEQASSLAAHVDALYVFLIMVAAFFSALIFVLVTVFVVKFRRSKHPRPQQIKSSFALEIAWSTIPLIIALYIFVWGAKLYWQMYDVPAHAEGSEVFVVGKQWMWKMHHPEGPREINQLHVPTGQAVRLTMTSEDVIHSFYVPAFRIKQDVLPGRYVNMWFEPIKPGTYHLFCAEYCGTGHSEMIGSIVAMEPAKYQEWLRGSDTTPSMATAGQQLYVQLGCQSCHTGESGATSPPLLGRFGQKVALKDGSAALFDEHYIRESILDPNVRVTQGYEAIMPTYRGQISEEGLLQMVAFLRAKPMATAPASRPATP
jgi:cytochrome c oxidase subunit 2